MTEYIGAWKNYIYRVLYACVYCGIALAVGHGYLGIGQMNRRHLFVTAFLFVLVFTFCALHLRGRLLFLAGGGAMVLVTWLLQGTENLLLVGQEYLNWALGRGALPEKLFLFQSIQLLWVILACTILAFLGEIFRPLQYLVLFGILAGAVVCVLYEWELPSAGMACFYAFVLLNLSQFTEQYWEKERKGQGLWAYVVWLWPMWILFFLVLWVTPSSPEPYDWEFARNIYSRVSEQWTVISQRFGKFGVEEFDVKMSGFREQSSLGGNLADNSSTFMRVSSQVTAKNNLYLAGVTLDTFDGREWFASKEERVEERRIDTLETMYAIQCLDGEQQYRHLEGMRLQLEYQYFRSEYFFLPEKTISLMWEQEELLGKEGSKQKIWQKPKNYGDSYSVYFYQLNGDREERERLLTEQPVFDEEIWRSVCRQFRGWQVTKEELDAYQADIRQTYGGGGTLTPELSEWLDTVTKGCETKLQRLYAIERALQSMYYTTTPGELPEEVDTQEEFLEYLLLQKKEGYCTYFATAFVLLTRAEGYPARFVKGFSVPMSGSREVLITGDMAHAWPEVYFEGIGWIPFEPTPGFGERLYTPWKEREVIKRNPGDVQFPLPDGEEEENPETEVVEEEPARDFWSLFVGIGVFACLLALIFATDLMLSRYRYKRSSLQEKFYLQMKRNMLIAAKLGVKRLDGETLSEFGTRLAETLAQDWAEPPIFWRLYEEVFYGDLPVTEEMVAAARKERLQLMEGLGGRDTFVEKYQLLREESC